VLVHGSVTGAELSWRGQRPLAKRWTLILPDRPGFGRSPSSGRVDFERDAGPIAELLDAGAHLVGHSYGGVVSLLAAAHRPRAVRSLTLIEPPALALAAGDPDVDRLVADFLELWDSGPEDPRAFLRRFTALVGIAPPRRSTLSAALAQGTRALMGERGPWEADIPLDELASHRIPTLVVSGGHSPAFDAVCDVLERRLDADRAVLRGAGHAVQQIGAPFNRRLEAFLAEAERRHAA
jgi:pimeloyl-ACP methyl ester carboxylesterase